MKKLNVNQRINIRAAIYRCTGGNIISEHFVNLAVCSDSEMMRVAGVCMGWRNAARMHQ